MVLQFGEIKVNQEITIQEIYTRFPALESSGAKFASIPCRSVKGKA